MESQVVPPRGDTNVGPTLSIIGGLFISIAFVLVSLRFYVRARIVKKLWWDDFFLLLGLLFAITVFGLSMASIYSGFGRHSYYLLPKQISFALKLLLIEEFFVIFSLMFTKISICLFLRRIFTTNRVWKRVIYIIMALNVATSLSAAFAVFLQCKPVAKFWNPTIGGTCWSKETLLAICYYQGGVSIFTDFLLAFLPSYFLKDIQISFRTKLSICMLMSLGAFTGICATIRTALANELFSSDVTYSGAVIYIWMGLEKEVAIIAAAIPVLRPLWAKSANQKHKNDGHGHWPTNKRRLNSTYAMMHQQMGADSLPCRLETRITAQGGQKQVDIGSATTPLPDCKAIMKPSLVSRKNSSLSDGEGRVEDVV